LFSKKPNGTNRKSGHFKRKSEKQGIRKEDNSKGEEKSRSRHSNGWEGTNKFVDGLVQNRMMNERVGKQKITQAYCVKGLKEQQQSIDIIYRVVRK
jgi:hypothetical protein